MDNHTQSVYLHESESMSKATFKIVYYHVCGTLFTESLLGVYMYILNFSSWLEQGCKGLFK